MQTALVLSAKENGITFFSDLLKSSEVTQVKSYQSAHEARRELLERDFDVVVINAPLADETGELLARQIAESGQSQVILVVANEFHDAVSAACEDYGVLTLSKPLNKSVFWTALKLAKSTQNRIKKMHVENTKLKQKIEDIRVIDRAKYILISFHNMTEQEAHKYIEKQAMDMRETKRSIAEGILKTYEN
ncbi:MAG: ANTAR domain-containing protein [Oscillospiraceae bacterium]|nr:ANTAR domain-containing protein [Oscillospiraceae bacterium]